MYMIIDTYYTNDLKTETTVLFKFCTAKTRIPQMFLTLQKRICFAYFME